MKYNYSHQIATILMMAILMIGLIGTQLKAETVLVTNGTIGNPHFEYQIKLDRETPVFNVWRITYPTPLPEEASDDQEAIAYLYLPTNWLCGDTPRTGVVCLDILAGDGVVSGLFATQFASRGIPTFLPIVPHNGERAKKKGSIKDLAKSPDVVDRLSRTLGQIHPDMIRGIDIFLNRAEVKSDYANLVGTSLGGILGAGLAARDARIDKTVLLLAGGNLIEILRANDSDWQALELLLDNASQEDQDRIVKALDILEPTNWGEQLAVKARAGKLRMINAEIDEVVPPSATLALAQVADMVGKVEIFKEVGHYTAVRYFPEILMEITNYFTDETIPLRNEVTLSIDDSQLENARESLKNQESEEVESVTEKQIITVTCDALLRLTDFDSNDSYCDMEAMVSAPKSLLAAPIRLALQRNGEQFGISVQADSPDSEIESIGFGISDFPWFRDGETLYVGSQEPTATLDILSSPDVQSQIQLVRGMMVLMKTLSATASIQSLLSVEMKPIAGRPRAIAISHTELNGVIELSPSGRQIQLIEMKLKGQEAPVILHFTKWIEENKHDGSIAEGMNAPFTKKVETTGEKVEQLVTDKVVNRTKDFELIQLPGKK